MKLKVPLMADLYAKGEKPEILFWVSSIGSFDEKAKKITIAFTKILNKANINFAILGREESCTGDDAKRAGNEFLFQIKALENIETLKKYDIRKIVTFDPHSFNTLKNEYPDLGGNYEVWHHTQFIAMLLEQHKITIDVEKLKKVNVTFHDPCYLGRANNEYESPRKIFQKLSVNLHEMKRSKSNSLCCGAGGSQMFKEPEKGNKEINILRTEEALSTNSTMIVTACPFCKLMLTDGVQQKEKQNEVEVLDIAEIVSEAMC